MALTVENICGLLIRSRLQAPEAVKAIYQRWQAESNNSPGLKDFTRWLIKNDFITSYQAKLLSAGHADSFFIGQYKILDRIGKGRMAGVYRAIHPLGQTVALKVLPPSKAKDPEVVARFEREGRLAVQLNHPSIVRTFQVGEFEGLHYMVMECLEGKTADELLKTRGRLPPKEAVRIAFLAALGLQHLHEKNMVHRDLKPGNLMLCPFPGTNENTLRSMVKILDIGLGRALLDSRGQMALDELTSEGLILGTPDYLAPEQARDARKADIRADIYSLGCALYHFLAGQPPFADDNPVRQVLRHATEQPRSAREHNRDVPEALDKIILTMLAKDPAQRHQTPGEAADALKSFLGYEAETPKPKVEEAERRYTEWLQKNEAAAAAAPGPPPLPAMTAPEAALFPVPAAVKRSSGHAKPPPSVHKLALLKAAKRRLQARRRQAKKKRASADGAATDSRPRRVVAAINVEPVAPADLLPQGFRGRDFLMLMIGALSVLALVAGIWLLNYYGYIDLSPLIPGAKPTAVEFDLKDLPDLGK